jgi:carbon-monoxide dehydrogenase large subunit
MRWVGRPLPRYEDPVLLRGRGRYTADLARGARILRFVRSPVARSPYGWGTFADLAERITVEIDTETPVVTLDQALAPNAPLVHHIAPQNTLIDARFESPGVDAAFTAADQVVEFTFTSGRQAAVPLETRGAVATFDPATGRVTLSASTQMPHLLRTGIADALGTTRRGTRGWWRLKR